MEKQKVYLSGGFKFNWQEKVIKKAGKQFVFYNPREHYLNDPKQYWAWDIHYVKRCDIVFAYMDKNNPSGYGLALEVGIALGSNKTIILVDERSKHDPQFDSYFKIIRNSASVVLSTLDEAIDYLNKFVV